MLLRPCQAPGSWLHSPAPHVAWRREGDVLSHGYDSALHPCDQAPSSMASVVTDF